MLSPFVRPVSRLQHFSPAAVTAVLWSHLCTPRHSSLTSDAANTPDVPLCVCPATARPRVVSALFPLPPAPLDDVSLSKGQYSIGEVSRKMRHFCVKNVGGLLPPFLSLKASSCEDVDFFLEKVWFFGMLKYALLHSPNEIIGKGVSGVLRSVLKCSTKNAKKLLWGIWGVGRPSSSSHLRPGYCTVRCEQEYMQCYN